jgi:hypothetical protein
MSAEFDWSKVKVRPAIGRPRRSRKQDTFVKTPRGWAERLCGAKYAATFKIAFCLLDKEWRAPGLLVRLSNEAAAAWGVSRWQKHRALTELSRLGLAQIEEGSPGQSPSVKLNLTEGAS